MKSTLHRSVLAASLALLASASALGQTSSLMRFETRDHREASGVHLGEPRAASPDETVQRETRHFTVVRAEGAHLMRVHFGQFDLDHVSEIHLTSIADGATQRFTHAMLEAWGGWSAIFNGDAVLVQLMVAPDESVSFEIDEVAVNMPPTETGEGDGGIASICGSDNRTASTDSRVGRRRLRRLHGMADLDRVRPHGGPLRDRFGRTHRVQRSRLELSRPPRRRGT
jgi:hypothetical protein